MRTALHPETLALQNLQHDHDDGRAVPVVAPIQLSASFARDANYELAGGYNYRRYGSPNVSEAEWLLASLEGGAGALAFASGLAAVSTLLATLGSGARIVAPRVMYHGAQDCLRRMVATRGAELLLFDQATSGDLASCIGGRLADLVWLETPCNPTWDVADIAESAGIAHAAGAIMLVDGTVAPPCTTRALALGADIVLHSATKYLNGHHDITGGVLVARRINDRWEDLQRLRKLLGNIMSPLDAWLLVRGMRTLFLRYARCSDNAQAIAAHFEHHARIERVLYPGLPSHPGHAIAKKQMHGGFGGMLSLLVRGEAEDARRVATATRLFAPATSLGGVDSLIEHRQSVEGPHSVVPDNLLRLSVGIAHVDDLIQDLEQALVSRDGR